MKEVKIASGMRINSFEEIKKVASSHFGKLYT